MLCVSSLADRFLPVRMVGFRRILHESMLLSEPGYTTIRREFSENISLKFCSKVRRPCFRAEIKDTYGMRVLPACACVYTWGWWERGGIEIYCFAREFLKFAGLGFVPILVFISMC